MNFRNIITCVAVLGLVAACASSQINEAANVTPSGSTFQKELHKGYLGLAKAEDAEHDWRSARHFAGKSTAAGKGQNVAPDTPASRDFTNKDKEVQSAYKRLNDALKGGAAQSNPVAAAEAQVAYDCWLQELEECWQPKDIAACKKRFEAAMAKLAGPAPMRKPESVRAETRGFIVFFDFDSSKLTQGAQRIVDAAAKWAKAGKKTSLIVTGHTDTSGSAQYNQGLSVRRANTVWSALVDLGLKAANMKVQAKGESEPLVSTGDGVKEPQNRRTEIEIRRQ